MVETVGARSLPGVSGIDWSRSGAMGWGTGGGGRPRGAGKGFQVGEVLSGVYEILGLVGTGAAGRVYEAHDRVLDRMVAIRAAEPHGMAGGLCAEARTLASLRAPMGLGVYAMGSHDGLEYVVMERLFGLSLRDRMLAGMGRRCFGLDEVLRILTGVAWSLAAAHRSGVSHHRLTPESVLLEAGNRVVLLAAGGDGTGACAGASPYLAPELVGAAAGAPGAGPAADIYALGVLAFELVTGRVPQDRDRRGHLLEAEIRDELGGQDGELAVHLGRLVGEMTAAEPARRPRDAAMLALWLQALGKAYGLALA